MGGATDITMEECFEDNEGIYSDSEKCGSRSDRNKWLCDGIELYLEQETNEGKLGKDRTAQESRAVVQHLPAFNQLRSKSASGTAPSGKTLAAIDAAPGSDAKHAAKME